MDDANTGVQHSTPLELTGLGESPDVSSGVRPAETPNQLPPRSSLPDPPLAPTRKRRLNAKRQQEWDAYRDYWRALLAEWEAGHLTQREFCELQRVKIGTFAKWRKKFREEQAASGMPTPERKTRRRRTTVDSLERSGDNPKPADITGHKRSAFVPLVVDNVMPTTIDSGIAVSWAGGRMLCVPLDTRAERVAELVAAIECIDS